jgi:hypothetical protein
MPRPDRDQRKRGSRRAQRARTPCGLGHLPEPIGGMVGANFRRVTACCEESGCEAKPRLFRRSYVEPGAACAAARR